MILIVDDEARYIDIFAEELKLSGYEVSTQSDVDEALLFFEQNLSQIDLVIMDVMMPPGSSFAHMAPDGLRTGVYLYNRIRERVPQLPVIVFTNISDSGISKRFLGDSKCWYLRKSDVLPFELVEEIERILVAT
jgi:CheY-like chemotaxis protein